MSSIKTTDDLKSYLYRALQLEHATIPAYLSALYSLHPQTNADASHVLRVVAVEEMLHLTIAANVMNAIGGEVDLTGDDFVPPFPTYLPDGEDDFEVSLTCFSPTALDTFLQIERPGLAPEHHLRRTPHDGDPKSALLTCPVDETLKFYSIGDFYEEIEDGLRDLHDEMDDALFCGDRAAQVTSEYYYSGGGKLEPVIDLPSALRQLDLIKGQGEGELEDPYDTQGELAHFYRFEQLKLGQYYMPGNDRHDPKGPPCTVDWSAVYPTMTNPTIDKLGPDDELREAAIGFNQAYADFLRLLTDAFGGRPELLLDAVPYMFRLRNGVNQLTRNPVPGTDARRDSTKPDPGDVPAHAAPTFELKGLGS